MDECHCLDALDDDKLDNTITECGCPGCTTTTTTVEGWMPWVGHGIADTVFDGACTYGGEMGCQRYFAKKEAEKKNEQTGAKLVEKSALKAGEKIGEKIGEKKGEQIGEKTAEKKAIQTGEK